MHKIYISAAAQDSDKAEQLSNHFAAKRRRGIVEVSSGTATPAGAEWQRWRLDQIGEATNIIVLISPAYIADDWLYEKELWAIKAAKHINSAKVILIPTSKFDFSDVLLSEHVATMRDEVIYFSDEIALRYVKQFN